MKTKISLSGLLGLVCMMGCLHLPLSAQDIHFSQFNNMPINLSPGLNGVFGGDIRAVGNFRDQWRSIVPYRTFCVSAEKKMYLEPGRYDRYLSAGLLVNADRQGSLQLSSLQVGLPISLTLPTRKNHFITLGVTPAFGQRKFSTDKMTFDAQWVNSVYDPLANSREDQLFQRTNIQYFDLSAGLNYRIQSPALRSHLDFGAGIHHFNRPDHDFWSSGFNGVGEVRLSSKQSFYAMGLLQIDPRFDLAANGLYQEQGTYRELVYGGGLRWHAIRDAYNEFSIQAGANYRHFFRDAIIPYVELRWKTWTLGVSYDWNWKSEVKVLTKRRAGPEVSLIYRHYNIKMPKFKSCPMI